MNYFHMTVDRVSFIFGFWFGINIWLAKSGMVSDKFKLIGIGLFIWCEILLWYLRHVFYNTFYKTMRKILRYFIFKNLLFQLLIAKRYYKINNNFWFNDHVFSVLTNDNGSLSNLWKLRYTRLTHMQNIHFVYFCIGVNNDTDWFNGISLFKLKL